LSWEDIKEELRRRLENSWEFISHGDINGSSKGNKVVRIKAITEKAFDIINEVSWHPSQKVDEKNRIFEFNVSDPWEMRFFISQFGPEVEILEPEELIQKYIDFLKKTLKLYENRKFSQRKKEREEEKQGKDMNL